MTKISVGNAAAIALMLIAATSSRAEKTKAAADAAAAAPAGAAASEAPAPKTVPGFSGKVVSTMDAGRYTYIEVDTGEKKLWAAAPKFEVKTGDSVELPPGVPMEKFSSPTLKRTFDVIYFVSEVDVAGREKPPMALPPGHPAVPAKPAALPAGHPSVPASTAEAAPAGAGSTNSAATEEHAPQAAPVATGKVVETMDAGRYTYVQVDTGKQKVWAAAPKFDVKVGDTVSVPAGLPMEKFQSPSLKREFDLIYFCSEMKVTPAAK